MWKYLIAWIVMLLVSVANGALRQFTFGKYVDEPSAHQISSVIGIFLLGIVIWGYVRLYPPTSGRQALWIGLLWMALTIAFEFLFFHYVGGRSLSELLANYNLLEGRVWIAVLAWVAIAPYVFFRFRQ